MEKINFSSIISNPARDKKNEAVVTELNKVGIKNVMISDCLVNKEREGLLVMQTLHSHFKQNRDLTYRIQILKDSHGKSVKPGQKYEWKFERRVRDVFGNKYNINQINEATRRGELRSIEIWHHAIVDEKGCITVGFEDAAILLDSKGVYYASGMPITSMPEFIEGNPKIHFWLYKEIDEESYNLLPDLTEKKLKN